LAFEHSVLNAGILTDLEFFYSLNAALTGEVMVATILRVFAKRVTVLRRPS
jgi:hypothetical protein